MFQPRNLTCKSTKIRALKAKKMYLKKILVKYKYEYKNRWLYSGPRPLLKCFVLFERPHLATIETALFDHFGPGAGDFYLVILRKYNFDLPSHADNINRWKHEVIFTEKNITMLFNTVLASLVNIILPPTGKKSTLRFFWHYEHFNSGKWHCYFTFT